MSSNANTWGNPAGTVGTLNGLFKETYANELENLIPDGVKILNKIKFQARDKQPGNLFHQPVILGLEHGVTFAGSDEDAFNLQAAVSGQIKDAQVKGNPALLRSVLGYNAASRATSSGPGAFEAATKFLVANMLRSLSKKLEIEMLYGQEGYGAVASGGVSGANVTIDTAEWAPGIWAGAENMPVEIRDVTGATSRGNFVIQSVNMNTRVLTLDSSATDAGVLATDVLWHKGAYGKEFIGIHQILSTTNGTVFNINVGTYNLFRGNSYSAGSAALSFTKLNLAAARAVEKGLDGMLYCLVNVRGWANMLSDQAALRQYDQSYSKERAENGSQKLRFFSQNGELEIEPSIYVKEGYAYLLSVDDWMRVGSSDLSFRIPGQGEEFFRHLTDQAGYELRLWTDQAVFCHAPGRSVLITNIVNAS